MELMLSKNSAPHVDQFGTTKKEMDFVRSLFSVPLTAVQYVKLEHVSLNLMNPSFQPQDFTSQRGLCG